MKKLMISMLAMAAMVSCTSEGILDDQDPVISDGLVPIKMTAEIGHLTMKAAIGQNEADGKLTADLAGVNFLRSDGATADWSTLGTPIQASILKANAAAHIAEGTIKFAEGSEQYYPKDGSTTHLVGYYPAATSTNNGIVSWTITGKEDIIISDVKSGSKTSAAEISFAFSHQLTQLQFTVKAPTGEPLTGEKLKSITVKKLRTTAQFDPDASGAPFTFTGEATNDLTTENPITGTDLSDTGVSGGTLLIEPSVAAADFDIEVVTVADNKEKTYKGTVKIGAAATTSYDVNLTISQKEVTGTATVGKWTSGEPVNDNII